MDTVAGLKLPRFQSVLSWRTLPRTAQGLIPLLAIGIAAYLRFQRLGEGGLGNPFYAAAVRSMSRSRHNFVFASFDPLGTFSVDKPPLALWLQTVSALLFGYKGYSLVLPQAIAGVAAVGLVWWVVARLQGTLRAGVAAAVLAVLPASVLVSRNNTMDTLVMMLSLGTLALALWGASSGRLLPMLLAGLAVGLAFNTKGFEAFVALPGILAYFWLASGLPLKRRIRHLAAMGAVAAVVGLSWVTAVSLVPRSDRPLVLNSDGDSALNLTFGYNGFDRVLGHEGFNPASNLTATAPSLVPPGVFYGGKRGPFRIFGDFPGPLVALVMPAVLAGACLLVPDFFDGRKRPAAALWLLWLGGGLAAFSASRLGSPHYLEAFSPALAACFAVAADAALGGSRLRQVIGLAGIVGSAAYALDRLTKLGGAGDEIRFLAVACLAFAAATALLILARRRRPLGQALALAPFVCVLAILFLMSRQAVQDAPIEGVQPGAVLLTEDASRAVRYDPANPAYSFITGRYDYLNGPLTYLQARIQPGQYLAAMRSFYMASAFISQRNVPALPIYSEFRNRPELPIEDLTRLVDEHKVEYFMVSLAVLGALYPAAADLVQARCPTDVSRQAGLAPQTGLQLWHCP